MAKLYLKLKDGRIYAQLDTTARVLKRRAHSSKHFLHRPPAIALDADQYDLYRSHFDTLHIYDLDTGREYRISARDFDNYRFEIQRGYGRQYAVCLNRWQCIDPNAPQEQLSLLEV